MTDRRRGIAMITVLGVLTLASVLAFAAAEGGHLALAGSRNRIAEAQGFWLAQGCAARALAALDERWAREDENGRDRFWRSLDEETAVLTTLAGLHCTMHLESSAGHLDLARTQAAGLSRLIAMAAPETPSDRLAFAVLAWRDSLSATSGEFGSGPLRRHALIEHLCTSQGLPKPVGERIVSLLSNGTGPVDVGRAPVPVLAALPGLNARSAERLANLRSYEPHLRDLYAMLGRLSKEDAEEMSRSFLELSREVVFLPATWSLIVTAGEPEGLSVTVAWSIGRSARHLVAAPAAG